MKDYNPKGITTRPFCQICRQRHSICFWVPDEVYKAAIRPEFRDGYICLECFIKEADEKLIEWAKDIKFYPVSAVITMRVNMKKI
jgi:hypothetical protein